MDSICSLKPNRGLGRSWARLGISAPPTAEGRSRDPPEETMAIEWMGKSRLAIFATMVFPASAKSENSRSVMVTLFSTGDQPCFKIRVRPDR